MNKYGLVPTRIYRMPEVEKLISLALAARDKEWVTVMEANFAKSLLCSFYPDTCDTCDIKHTCHTLRWQQFKLSLQSSEALTNLMGKFPDLPDVREVGQ
jgi:hypothetical protein